MIRLVRGMAGLILWSAAFATLYALEGLGCARGWAEVRVAEVTVFRMVLVAGWAVFIAAHVALLAAFASRRWGTVDPFWRRFEIAIAVTGLAATLWTLFPAAFLTAGEQG